MDRWGEEKKEGRTGRRARDRKQDAGCRADSREPTDSEREARKINSVRSGFIPPGPRNWTGPRREPDEEEEGEEEQRFYIYVALPSGQKKMYVTV